MLTIAGGIMLGFIGIAILICFWQLILLLSIVIGIPAAIVFFFLASGTSLTEVLLLAGVVSVFWAYACVQEWRK